jgi:hypothetical protein
MSRLEHGAMRTPLRRPPFRALNTNLRLPPFRALNTNGHAAPTHRAP